MLHGELRNSQKVVKSVKTTCLSPDNSRKYEGATGLDAQDEKLSLNKNIIITSLSKMTSKLSTGNKHKITKQMYVCV